MFFFFCSENSLQASLYTLQIALRTLYFISNLNPSVCPFARLIQFKLKFQPDCYKIKILCVHSTSQQKRTQQQKLYEKNMTRDTPQQCEGKIFF